MTEAGKRAKSPRQPSLFDTDPAIDASELVAVPKRKRPLNGTQRTFNRLSARIRRGREQLAAWDAFHPRFRSRVVDELEPIEREIRAGQRRLALQLNALLSAPKGAARLSGTHRAKLHSLLLDLLDDLLESAPDAELEALYDHHSDTTIAEQRQFDMELAEAAISDTFGPEMVEGHEAQNVDELLRHAREQFESRTQTDEATADHAGRRRASRSDERKAEAAREANLSLREIYRKLVSALHPDRETDAAERKRKTTLMQRANQAYERNDLLELLSLQIETEQIDAAEIANMPERRLRHYNEVLLVQAGVLDRQLQQQAAVFCGEFDLAARDVTPRLVDQALSARIADARRLARRLAHDSMRLEDPRRRRSFIAELADPGEDDIEPWAADLASAFDHMVEPARPTGRRSKRRRR